MYIQTLSLYALCLIKTDFAYNHNGLYLAVSDSDGNVFIYNKNGDNYTKTA